MLSGPNRFEEVQVGSDFDSWRLTLYSFPSMTGKRPTISDVARQTGVSKATVSAVLNDSEAVSIDTRDRVLATIESLNYRPSQQSGVRAATRYRSIALIIKEYD